MKKKVLSLLLVLAMAFSMIPMASATVNTNYGLVTGVAIGAPESTIYNTDNPGSDAWHTRGNKTITSVDEFANWVITNRDYDAGTSGDVTLGADLDFEGATVEVPRNSNTILFDGHKIQNARFVFPMTPGSIDVKDAANFENCSFEGGTGDEEAGFVRARSSGVFTNCYFAGTSGNVFIARNAPSSVTCVNCLFDRGSSPAFAVGRSEVTGPIALSHCVIRGASRACVLLDDAYVRTTSKTTGSVTLDKCLMIGARELGSDQGVGKNVTVTNGNLTSDIMIVSCVPEASTTDIQINNSPAVTYNTANAVDNYGVISGDSGVPAEATGYGLITGVAIGAPGSTIYNTDNPGSGAWYTRGNKTINSVDEFANWVITNRDYDNATASDVTLGANLDFKGATVEVPRNSYAFNFNGHRIQNARFVFQVAQNSSIDVKDAANFENCSFEGGQGYSETGFVRARSSGVFTNCYFVGTSGNVFIGRNKPSSVTCVNCLFDRGASPAYAVSGGGVDGTIALTHCVIRGSTRACVFTDSANVETTDAGVGNVTLEKCLMIGTRALGSDQGVGRNVTVSNGNLTSDIMIVSCVAGASTTDVQINDSPAVTYNTANAVDNYGVISGDVVVSETYTVTWKSQDGATTYETDAEVAENAAPSYDGDAPTKDADAEYTYTFAGWATTMNAESGTAVEALPAVTADVTYYAAFSKTAKPVVPAAGDEAAATQLTGLTFAIAEADAAGDVPEAYDAEYSYFFEITATTGNVTAFDADENSWATVTMAFDDVANLGNYTLARWDDTEGWVFTGLRNLDAGATAGTVTFQTNHLSGFGLLTSTPDQPHYYATVALRGEAADLLDEAAETEAGIDRHVDDNDQPINDLKVGDEITITVHPSIDIDGSWIYVKWDSDFLTLTNAPAGWVRMTSASGHQMDSDATSMEYYALETISLLKDAGDSMGDFEFTVAAPATVSDADLPIEIPFQFFGSPVALTGTSYAGSHIDMLYTDTLVRLSDLAIDYVVEVVQYGANTAQILVYSKTAGTFTYDDADVLSVTNKAFLDVTGAGYIYRSTYANLAEQANEFYGTTEIPTTAPADVYVYSWIVNGNRLLTASAQSIIDDNHKDIEAYVATKLTFSSEVQTENIRYTNESDVNGDGKINLHDKEAVRQMMEGSGSATVAEEATNAADRTAVLTARYDDILANNQRVALRCDFDRTAGNEKFVDEAVEYAVYEGIYLN